MRLFDEIERNDYGPSNYTEPIFTFLNRSARVEIYKIRDELEKWYSHYPAAEQAELCIRFRSNIRQQHQSAFFELFLHELLLRLGYEITIHPSLLGVARTPDFLVKSSDGEQFYIEATLATNESSSEAAAHARVNAVYDVLNRVIKSPNFFLWMNIKGTPETPPPAKKIASFLNVRLAELDPDEIIKLHESGKTDTIPKWHFEHDGWDIEFEPIPKKPEARNKPGVRPLGGQSFGLRMSDQRTPIRDAITGKAGRYGELDLPYIIAVNVLEIVDEIDIMEALFGKEQFTVTFPQNDLVEPINTEMSRLPDGAWTGIKGPRNTRVSAVLLVTELSEWNIPRVGLRLYHNPWATKKLYQTALYQLPQGIVQENHMEKVNGEATHLLFDLSTLWPNSAG